MKAYVYGLRDPDNEIIMYVGESCRPKYRLRQHIKAASDGKRTLVYDWIRGLLAQGKDPRMVILEETSSRWVHEKESAWITHYRSLNPSLVNHSEHGKTQRVKTFQEVDQLIQRKNREWAEHLERMRVKSEQEKECKPERPARESKSKATLFQEGLTMQNEESFEWLALNPNELVKGIHSGKYDKPKSSKPNQPEEPNHA